jgi:hypothetical protein
MSSVCPSAAFIFSEYNLFQLWTRLIRFVAAETSQVHIGQPVSSNLDGLFSIQSYTAIMIIYILCSWTGCAHKGNHQSIWNRWLCSRSCCQSYGKSVDRKETACSFIKRRGQGRALFGIELCRSRSNYKSIPLINSLDYFCWHRQKQNYPSQRKSSTAVFIPRNSIQHVNDSVPILFYKPVTTLIGPSSSIIIPKVAQPVQRHVPDYEVELAVVIGKSAKNISEEDALDFVLGYTGSNDVNWPFSKVWHPANTPLSDLDIVPRTPEGYLSMGLL